MRKSLPITFLLLALVYFATTGFQCGSAETTSAKLYMQQKQWAKAEESLLKEVAKNDKDEEAWFLLGQVRYEAKNYTGMNEAFSKALGISDVHKAEIFRTRLAIWAQMYNDGVASYNKGKDEPANFKKSIEEFDTAISMSPDSSGTYYVSALAFYAVKDYKGAQAKLETALQKKPDFGDAAHFLGQIHYLLASEKLDAKDSVGARSEYAAAAIAFEQVYKTDPGNPENITNLIDVYERTKETKKALQLTREAAAKDPNNKVFAYAYGVFLLRQDSYAEAIEQFKKALAIDPNYLDAIYNLGVSNLNWGVSLKQAVDKKAEGQKKGKEVKDDMTYKEKFKAALPYLEKSAELRADDAALWQQLGRLYANLNMVEKSKAAFERLDKITKGK